MPGLDEKLLETAAVTRGVVGHRSVTIPIPDARVSDLLCAGFEGGIGYWATRCDYVEPDNAAESLALTGVNDPKYMTLPLTGSGAVLLHDIHDPWFEDHEDEPHRDEDGKCLCPHLRLDSAAIDRGLVLLATTHRHLLAELLNDNEDAATGDNFIQLALMGEVRYG